MGHLGEGNQITTVEDKEIVLTASNGQHFRMKVADLAEAVRQVIPVATNTDKGLADSNFYNSKGSVYIESWENISGLNLIYSPGSYTVRTADGSIWGHLIVFFTGMAGLHGNIIQFLIKPGYDQFLKYRANDGPNLEITTEWKSISFT